jgi:large subunit ribosomal protein L9
MKVILLQDIDNIGKKYDIKTVKDGYARNFLVPKKLVRAATKSAILSIKELKKKEVKKNEEQLIQVQKSASELDGQEIEFFVKTGEDDQLFEAITSLKISTKLKEMGFEIKKDQIILDKPIKELGEFSIKINLEHQLEAKILLVVESDKETETNEEG